MNILVGCPVHHREWALPSWFEYIESAFAYVGEIPNYIFALDRRDESTFAAVLSAAHKLGREIHIVDIEDDLGHPEKRDWCERRTHHMVYVRNSLLNEIRNLQPDYFISIDSDILLSRDSLKGMLELAPKYDAVGGKVYLSRAGTRHPSVANIIHGKMVRNGDVPYEKPGAKAIMALKLMKSKAYNIDYTYHPQTEDIGWSIEAGKAGLYMGFDGRYVSKHMWNKDFLNVYDKRVGY